jgi:hypothetical protein
MQYQYVCDYCVSERDKIVNDHLMLNGFNMKDDFLLK